nr:MAG TPA: Muramidase (flagellum-specific) [Caudoviricetes sp.]
MELPIINTKYEHVNNFINTLAPIVCNEWVKRRRSEQKTISPAVVIAQGGKESGWNLNAATLFGIKGSDVTLDTSEYINGEYVHIKDGFASYPDIAGAVQGYYNLMQWDNYNDATSANTVEGELEGLTNDIGLKYATAPDYYETTLAIINDFGLRVFNDYVWDYVNNNADSEPSTPSDEQPVEDNSSDSYETKYHVGDYVSYHTIYASSTSENGLTPSITGGIITNIIASARNPYLINDGTGWINDDCIVENNDENTSESESPDVEESTGLTHSVGEYVTYSAIFETSTSDKECTPLYTEGTITDIAEGARNPYLIENGRGWVNDSVINGGSAPENTYEEPSYDTYEVESGDCLSTIGDKLGVDWYSIAEANGIGEPYTIYPGQSLIIPR